MSVVDAQCDQGSRGTYVCSHDSDTVRLPFAGMHRNHASLGYGLVNEPARGGEVSEQVHVFDVWDRKLQLLDPASRNVSWDMVRADRDYVGDPPFR